MSNVKKDYFLSILSNLKINKKETGISPHKYLLLLSLIKLFDQNENHINNFTFSEIEPIFIEQYNKYFPDSPDYRKMLEFPFYHMQSEKFWKLKIKREKEDTYYIYEKSFKRLTKKRLLETVEYAYLEDNFYKELRNTDTRSLMRDEIIMIIKNINSVDYSNKDMANINLKEEGSLYEHENIAIELIKNSLYIHRLGKILCNLWLYEDQSKNYYEFDIILVARTGIYIVELKHWTGHIQIAPYNWIINKTHYRNDPHKSNGLKCRILKGLYQHRFRTYPDIWVESIVVLTNNEAVVEGALSPIIVAERKIHNPTFASINDFIIYLNKRATNELENVLNNQQVDFIIDYLNSLNNPKPNIKYTIPGYETVEYVTQKPECVELIARSIEGKAKGLKRFRVFRTPHNISHAEKERFVKKAYNTLSSVEQIGEHPHVLKVWVIKNDEGDIIEGSEWSETGTLRDLMHEYGEALPLELALDICRGTASALYRAHSVDVIHRAVKPENILIMNEIPKLMNFDLAYQIEDNRVTVLTDFSKIKDDGYIAPEILSGQDIDEGTDFFSLAAIAYELITGSRPFSSTREFVAKGGVLNEQSMQKLNDSGAPQDTIDTIRDMLFADRSARLSDGQKIIAAFNREKANKQESIVPFEINPVLTPGSSHDVYEIVEKIGQGAEAQIYKAATVRGKQVVLKLFNKEFPRERIFRESEITSTIESGYVVHSDDKLGHWDKDRYFIVLDYIDGESMRTKIDRCEKPDLKMFISVAFSLMEAISAFHGYKDEEGNARPFLHSDIKPDNIMITKDNKPVLIDCGIAGEPRTDVFGGTVGYIPPDSILGTDMRFSQDGDLFALGVTLWEWFTGRKPYENPSVGMIPHLPEDMKDVTPGYLQAWLIKSVATEASNRFSSIEEMRDAFINRMGQLIKEDKVSIEPLKIKVEPQVTITSEFIDYTGVNSFVLYLNTLSNASAANENATAESQIENPFFKKIFVNNPLTDYVKGKIIDEGKNIILTGNAGDGKTTIAFEFFSKLTGEYRSLKSIEPIPLNQQNLIIVKDMSELTESQRIEVIKDAVHNTNNRYLIVSNTGTLLDSMARLDNHGLRYDESELLEALESNEPLEVLDKNFLIINIGRMDSIQTAGKVFRRMMEPGNWTFCSECQISNECPVFINVMMIQEKLKVVCERVSLLYRRLFEYNARLTMRQMTGHLAYSINAGLTCHEIVNMSQTARQNSLIGSLFINRFFGDDGNIIFPEAMQLLPVRQIQKAGFGIILDPYFEQAAWMKGNSELKLTGKYLNQVYQSFKSKLKRTDPLLRRQVRRLAYFFGSAESKEGKVFISIFLRSPMLLKFIEFQGNDVIPPLQEKKYRNRILQVLQEYFIGMRMPEETWQERDIYITLNRRFAGTGTQMVLADYRTDDFELVLKPGFKVEENSKKTLILRHKRHTKVNMQLDLPFLDFVEKRYEGEIAEELSGYYADRLECFKVELLKLYRFEGHNDDQYLRLLRIDPARRFIVTQLSLIDGKLEVLV